MPDGDVQPVMPPVDRDRRWAWFWVAFALLCLALLVPKAVMDVQWVRAVEQWRTASAARTATGNANMRAVIDFLRAAHQRRPPAAPDNSGLVSRAEIRAKFADGGVITWT